MSHKLAIWRITTGLILGIGLLAPAMALPDDDWLPQRYQFQEALQAIKAGNRERYHKLADKLHDYPLYPYLEYGDLRRRLERAPADEIRDFMERHGDTPIAGLLHQRWLHTLARQGRWQALVNHYRMTSDKNLQCHYANALYQVKQPDRAHTLMKDLWLTGRSLPDSCDPAIAAWRDAGRMSDELVWQRIELVIRAGRIRLALFLADYLPESERYWVNIWSKIRRDPTYLREVTSHFQDNVDHPVLRWITVYGLTRLADREPVQAARYWANLNPVYQFSPRETERVERRLSLALVRAEQPEAKAWLARLDLGNERTELKTEYILSALEDRDWQTALAWLDQLPPEIAHSQRWRYWRARVLDQLGRDSEARSLYQLTASDRSYYSYLAADRAGDAYHFAHRPLLLENDALKSIHQIPALQRAAELYTLGRVADARREWNHALARMNEDQLLRAAKLADEWGWHDRVIMTLARARHWDDLEMRFPLAHQQTVLNQARNQQIDPAWAFAVIRQESAFTTDARSHAGALGLMQLLPRTAHHVARSLSLSMHGQQDILDVDNNIKLGVRYLRRVKDRFHGNPVLATAAYNAGGSNVRRWLPQDKALPADVWIETVPFNETRNYLQRVLTYTVIYEQRLGRQPAPMLERMPPVSLNPNVTLLESAPPDRDS
ncbi:transglycosylase SLT domain-containing protein [Thiohalophilus thiocyanatoxydans]|uniref:Soluble lytic murein transglycosylase n=1 Tax=Thiohalophilus thiocyanatoxydans TaxID=381308 RepID=A0A4R8IUL1_9GAMM|nr:transglycosylase SLT domain-containing protein [Thiohalophilus thiocyanatoxydans]TDY00993.1 soluble lytic murein transglycosylase [Thiohalophilus thiocyanatoxydans]